MACQFPALHLQDVKARHASRHEPRATEARGAALTSGTGVEKILEIRRSHLLRDGLRLSGEISRLFHVCLRKLARSHEYFLRWLPNCRRVSSLIRPI